MARDEDRPDRVVDSIPRNDDDVMDRRTFENLIRTSSRQEDGSPREFYTLCDLRRPEMGNRIITSCKQLVLAFAKLDPDRRNEIFEQLVNIMREGKHKVFTFSFTYPYNDIVYTVMITALDPDRRKPYHFHASLLKSEPFRTAHAE